MTRTLLLLLMTMSGGLASTQQPAPRDASATPATGTASISGTVVTDEGPSHAVRRAIVTLTGAGLVPNRGAITDDDGRFTMVNLPAGRFTLTAMRGSFVTSVYGAKRPGRSGTAIVIGDGQHVGDLVVKMWRGAAIDGVLRDDTGAPVAGIPVSAIPAHAPGSTGVLTLSNNGTTTNDRGEFRIFGLEPGTYVVSAKPPAGGGPPLIAPSEADVDAIFDAMRRRATTPASTSPAPPLSAKPFDYAPIFFPGTASLAQATPLTLVAGQELTAVDFALQRVSTAQVSGVVTRPDGSPAGGATLQMTAVTSNAPFSSDAPAPINATASSDGSFRISQVTPGDYRLVAKAPVAISPPSAPGAGGFVVSPGNTQPSLWSQSDVSVTGSDITGLRLSLAPGITIAGTVIFDGTIKPPADLTKIQVWLKMPNLPQRPGTPITSIAFVLPAFVRADASFEIANVLPGSYELVVSIANPTAGWSARSAMMGERDLLDGRFEITREAAASGLAITFTDRHTELSGTLQSDAGAPAADVFVIVYAADRKFWGPAARRVCAIRPDADGHYSIADLPPGDYLMSAVADIDQDEWQNPAFLETLVGASVKLSIADGEKKVQDVKIGG